MLPVTCMTTHSNSDSGLILAKKNFLKNDKLVIIFSENSGKISLIAKNIKTITSKRLSHLESGNFIKFSYSSHGEYSYLQETELTYGHSKIKLNTDKIHCLYHVLFTLNQLLPERQMEEEIFKRTLEYLKYLNNREETHTKDLHAYMNDILILGGYLNIGQTTQEYFNPHQYLEELIQKKIKIPTF